MLPRVWSLNQFYCLHLKDFPKQVDAAPNVVLFSHDQLYPGVRPNLGTLLLAGIPETGASLDMLLSEFFFSDVHLLRRRSIY